MAALEGLPRTEQFAALTQILPKLLTESTNRKSVERLFGTVVAAIGARQDEPRRTQADGWSVSDDDVLYTHAGDAALNGRKPTAGYDFWMAEVTTRLWMPKPAVTDARAKSRALDGWAKLTEGVALGSDLPGFLARLAGQVAGGGLETVVTTQGSRDALAEFFREFGTMVIRNENHSATSRAYMCGATSRLYVLCSCCGRASVAERNTRRCLIGPVHQAPGGVRWRSRRWRERRCVLQRTVVDWRALAKY